MIRWIILYETGGIVIVMEPFILDQPSSLLRLAIWERENPSLVAGFTTRIGGQSQKQNPFHAMNCGLHVGDDALQVIQNRRKLCDLLHFPFDTWTCADQIHSNQVAIIDHNHVGRGRVSMEDTIKGTDGLITGEPNILLTSFYADCVPLFFYVPVRGVIGIAHSGWRGTAANIAQNMVDTLRNHYQVLPEQIQVAIGPSIGVCCYEVDEQVIQGIMGQMQDSQPSSFFTQKINGKYTMDLKEANTILLKQAGIPAKQIISSQWCTSCRTDLFFSHRKEEGKTGRMAAFIGWRKEV